MPERRRFSRIVYRAPATLTQGEHQLACHVQDLSMHGLLLYSDADCANLDPEHPAFISFILPGSDIEIDLSARLVDVGSQVLRVSIDHIDIDSISHLKRLVELNVGDDALLHRNIEYLSDLGDHS
ncbi:PilZ domain-containing protein [Vibrio sp.]|uniref:PilZ domain-containing protein n=1 Tax=Vibrio sp. TaxID=678 RepID=UPI003D0ABE06